MFKRKALRWSALQVEIVPVCLLFLQMYSRNHKFVCALLKKKEMILHKTTVHSECKHDDADLILIVL